MPYFEKLNDINYIDWSCLMEAHLTQKELWEVIVGSESRPTGSVNIKAVRTWVRRQWLACMEIILHVETEQLPHTCFEDPRDIWTSLEKIHCTCGFVTCLLLQQHFLSMMKDAAKPMSPWIAAVKQVTYQLTEISATATNK